MILELSSGGDIEAFILPPSLYQGSWGSRFEWLSMPESWMARGQKQKDKDPLLGQGKLAAAGSLVSPPPLSLQA